MALTPFLKLQKPPFDTVPWDVAMNGNMDIIDAFMAKYMSVPNYAGAWTNTTAYVSGQNVLDSLTGVIYLCEVSHTSSDAPASFANDRVTFPANWLATSQSVSTVSPGDVGRNLFHNGLFRIQQRGVGPFTSTSNTADRWTLGAGSGGGTRSLVIANIGDAARAQIGDEEAAFTLNNTFSGGSAAGDYDLILQRIEGLRQTAGKTITISFWASASGALKLGINASQVFGTGGSPSPSVLAQTIGSVVTLSTVWTRYSVSINIPSVAGKTFGTIPNTACLQINFFCSSGATQNAQAGNIGVQAGTINLWGMQCEVGTIASPLEKMDIQQNLANCQRYYQVGAILAAGWAGVAGLQIYAQQTLPVLMRGTPSITTGANTSGNLTAPTILNVSGMPLGALAGSATATAIGAYVFNMTYTASADL